MVKLSELIAHALTCSTLAALPASIAAADLADRAGSRDEEAQQIRRGFVIAPVRLDLRGKDSELVGLGSYIVNTSACNDCHTHPAYAAGGDPFAGQPEQVNVAQYMAGGREFPPTRFVSPNITPDEDGKPAGLTLAQFRITMRTGHNPLDPPTQILHVMPWPSFGKKTDHELRAMYEYLRAIPSLPDNENTGP
jgi:hypothetical protein